MAKYDTDLHIRAAEGEQELWRLSLEAVDGWKTGAHQK